MIQGREEIRAAYRDEKVARDYVTRRFREPLGAMVHDLQLARMRDVIRALQPRRVLEIAPGPARLTLDLAADFLWSGTLVDTSKERLAEARARLADAGHPSWYLVQGDAFCLPFCGPFDLIYSFRLIRHFDDAERARLYAGIARPFVPAASGLRRNEEVARTIRRHAGNATALRRADEPPRYRQGVGRRRLHAGPA
jgi:SAM-dependent methyltransferase